MQNSRASHGSAPGSAPSRALRAPRRPARLAADLCAPLSLGHAGPSPLPPWLPSPHALYAAYGGKLSCRQACADTPKKSCIQPALSGPGRSWPRGLARLLSTARIGYAGPSAHVSWTQAFLCAGSQRQTPRVLQHRVHARQGRVKDRLRGARRCAMTRSTSSASSTASVSSAGTAAARLATRARRSASASSKSLSALPSSAYDTCAAAQRRVWAGYGATPNPNLSVQHLRRGVAQGMGRARAHDAYAV
jgi:hypothetical protein